MIRLLQAFALFSFGALSNAEAATIEVTSTADAPGVQGTLRKALANAVSGDNITFNSAVFPVGGFTTIAVAGQLPTVPIGVSIDGDQRAGIDGGGP